MSIALRLAAMLRLWRLALLLVILMALPPLMAWFVPPQTLLRLGIDASPRERAGLEYTRRLGDLLQHLERYHAASGTSENLDLSRDALRSQQLDIAAAMEALDQLDRTLGGFLATSARWATLKNQWQDARGRRPGPSAAALVETARALIASVGETFGLLRDRGLDGYRLMEAAAPTVRLTTENLAAANAAGVAVMVRNAATADEKAKLAKLSASIKSVINMLDQRTQTAFREDPDLKAQIGPAVQDCFISGHLFLDLIDSKLLKGRIKDIDAEDWAQSAQHAIDATTRLGNALSLTAETVLQARLEDFSRKQYLRTTLLLAPGTLVPLVLLILYRIAKGMVSAGREVARREGSAALARERARTLVRAQPPPAGPAPPSTLPRTVGAPAIPEREDAGALPITAPVGPVSAKPAMQPEPAPPTLVVLPRPAARGAGEPGSIARILVGEQNATDRQDAVQILQELGYQVDVVENGSAAVEAIQRTRYALALLAAQLAEMGGAQVCSMVRKLEAEQPSGQGVVRLPIIAMTDGTRQAEPEQCLAAGMDDIAFKPLRAEVLRALVERWMRPVESSPAIPADSKPDESQSTDETSKVTRLQFRA